MDDKEQLKKLLEYINVCHDFPKWFDVESNGALIEELRNKGVLYTADGKRRAVMANYYDNSATENIKLMYVNKILLKSLYGVEI